MTDDFLCSETKAYLEKADTSRGVVLFIDVSEDWSSGFDSQEVLNGITADTGFRHYNLLCEYSFSETYLLY